MSTNATKTCPYCGETIIATAIKCRFCGEFVDERPESPRLPETEAPDAVQFIIPVNVSGWAIAACYAGFIGMCLPFVGLLFAIPAVIFALIALKRRPKTVGYGEVTGNIRAILGLVFGILGVLAWGVVPLVFVVLGAAGVLK